MSKSRALKTMHARNSHPSSSFSLIGLALCLVTLLAPTASVARGQQEPSIDARPGPSRELGDPSIPERRVFWEPFETPQLLFVPQAVLSEGLEKLPISTGDLESLRTEQADQQFYRRWIATGSLQQACREETGRAACERPRPANELSAETGIPPEFWERRNQRQRRWFEEELDRRRPAGCLEGTLVGTSDRFQTPTGLAEYGTSAFVGRVRQVVPGWNFRNDHPTTMVYSEVIDVLRNGVADLWPGKLVVFEEGYGSVTVEGETLCASIPAALDPAAPLHQGQVILVQAYGAERKETDHLVYPLANPVEQGLVRPRTPAVHPLPTSLDEVRSWLDRSIGSTVKWNRGPSPTAPAGGPM